jgi:hypothetical protein
MQKEEKDLRNRTKEFALRIIRMFVALQSMLARIIPHWFVVSPVELQVANVL